MTENDEKFSEAPDELDAAAEPTEAEEAEGPPLSADVEQLKQRARERDEYLDLLQRTRAEYLNYRKRVERERERLVDDAVGAFVLRLLPVIDDFDRALAHAEETADVATFARGIQLIENKLHEVLKANGVEPVVPEGERFDPSEHEAVHVEYTEEAADQTVVEVVRKGYRVGGRILRPAQVRVAMRPPGEPPSDTEADAETSDDEE